MNKIIPILGIAVLVTVSFMVIVYFEPESFGLTKPYTSVGSYDGAASKMALMISEQCLDQEENPFKDYAFARTSNGEYYIDNVICERINVHQGGCLEPFSKGYPDETCKNRVTFDFPYGEKGTPINKEFCNQVESERSPDDSEHNKIMIDEYVNICTIRGLIDSELEIILDSATHDKQLRLVLESCECKTQPTRGCFAFGANWQNSTHFINNTICKFIPLETIQERDPPPKPVEQNKDKVIRGFEYMTDKLLTIQEQEEYCESKNAFRTGQNACQYYD